MQTQQQLNGSTNHCTLREQQNALDKSPERFFHIIDCGHAKNLCV